MIFCVSGSIRYSNVIVLRISFLIKLNLNSAYSFGKIFSICSGKYNVKDDNNALVSSVVDGIICS